MALLPLAKRTRFIRIAPTLSICSTLLLVTLVCIWGLRSDLGRRHDAVYDAAINESRSHAERSAGRIEMELDEGSRLEEFRRDKIPKWLLNHWQHAILGKPNHLYAAVTDNENRVLSHSMDFEPSRSPLTTQAPSHQTQSQKPQSQKEEAHGLSFPNRLQVGWNAIPLENHGPGVHRTSDPALSRGLDAIDITVAIEHGSEVVGFYHSGLEHAWLDAQVRDAQRNSIRGWLGIIASIAVIVLVSTVSLYRLGTHTIQLEQALGLAETRRLADLSRLIVGMAHELRNPLNAVRLNLFTSEKLIRGDSKMRQEDAIAMIRESVSEVERVEDLIGQLLGYARVETQERPWIDVDAEINSTLQFMRQIHHHHSISIEFYRTCECIEVRIDRKHLRQILLNLLHNARQAMPTGGRILVGLSNHDDHACIVIEDSGPGVETDQFDRIFEPFYSTRDDGVGLGLAVVRSLVESAGGHVQCELSSRLGGMQFTIELPSRARTIATEMKVAEYPISEGKPKDEYDSVDLSR